MKVIVFGYYKFVVLLYIWMETMRDVLCFLSQLDFAEKLDDDYPEKMVEVKKMMVREFEHYNISKMIYALNNIDEMKLSDVTNDLDHHLERTDSLGSFIFSLISFKHLVDTNDKQEDKP